MCPPTATSSPATTEAGAKTATNIATFDASGTLLATRSESMPTTVWIWDVPSRVLRRVLVLHAPIMRLAWHPSVPDSLLIRCEGEESKALVHLWDPSLDSPRIIDFSNKVPGGKIIGKSVARWLNVGSPTPAVFFSDTQDSIIASLVDSEDDEVPWHDAVVKGVDIYGQKEESPLNLVPADEMHGTVDVHVLDDDEELLTNMSGGSEEMDDTFEFRKGMDC